MNSKAPYPRGRREKKVIETGLAGVARSSVYVPEAMAREPLQLNDVVLHHLQTPVEIRDIVGLREEIDLSVHTAAGRQPFERLEKKETSAGSSVGSSSAGSGSARSASSRWARN
jgi:hypothetical protein